MKFCLLVKVVAPLEQTLFNPLHYQYNIKHRSDENKEKYQFGSYQLIQYQILQIDIITVVWQTVRRITYEILGVKGLILVIRSF